MRVTVCQLPNELGIEAWSELVSHAQSERSELVLLPEMPFSPWIAADRNVDASRWDHATAAHRRWHPRLAELAPAVVIGTEPVTVAGRPLNRGFLRLPDGHTERLHDKVYLPDEEGFWEASWYRRGAREFETSSVEGCSVGMLICTEMWFTEIARTYARRGIHILASPRATGGTSLDKWIAGGRAAAIMSGSFCLSSNRGGIDRHGFRWAGAGWVIHPEEGDVIGVTSESDPFLTVDIDLDDANRAKLTYPRYVRE